MNIQIVQTSLNNGFKMTFENELTISVQTAKGNYCTPGETAEIAIWDKTGEWYRFDYDTVLGHLTTDEVAEWINRVKNATNIQTI